MGEFIDLSIFGKVNILQFSDKFRAYFTAVEK